MTSRVKANVYSRAFVMDVTCIADVSRRLSAEDMPMLRKNDRRRRYLFARPHQMASRQELRRTQPIASAAPFHAVRTPDRQLDAPDNNAPARCNHDDTPQHFDNG